MHMGSVTDEDRCRIVARIIRTLSFPILHRGGVNLKHMVLVEQEERGKWMLMNAHTLWGSEGCNTQLRYMEVPQTHIPWLHLSNTTLTFNDCHQLYI